MKSFFNFPQHQKERKKKKKKNRGRTRIINHFIVNIADTESDLNLDIYDSADLKET